MKKLIFVILLFISTMALGQEKQEIKESDYSNNKVEMADVMRSEGKIYVVVGVIVVILLVLIGYTVLIDRKVSKLERTIGQPDENHNE